MNAVLLSIAAVAAVLYLFARHVLPGLIVARDVVRRSRLLLVALGLAVVALSGWLALHVSWPWASVPAAALGWGWHRWRHSASTVRRWGARTRRTHGMATTVDIGRTASAWAMRRRAGVVRPSLAELSRWERLRMRTVEVAVPLCRVGLLRVWSSVEDVVLIFGGPRVGKSGWLAGRIIDAPGAVLVTTTRPDLPQLTAGLRAERGPVYTFNPVGLGDLESTITFDPLTGCADPVAAQERATDLLAAGSYGVAGDRAFWDAQARRVLAALLHAAALGELHMRDVLRWVADPDGAKREVLSLLRKSTEPSYSQDATQFLTTNERTRSSITSTIMPALGWLTSPAASAAASGAHPLDVAQLIESRAAVYLLGAEESQVAPLVCALTGHVAREARRIAARQPSGRLDPPLTLALDEAALISPVPLDSWSADMGGRGVTIVAAFQSRAQVIARWGETGAAVILNNAGAVMAFGGTKDRDDLGYWSTLAGERDEVVETADGGGHVTSRSVRKVAVLPPAQLANLPEGWVVVFRRGMPPVIGTVAMAWRRRDVRTQAVAERADAEREALTTRWRETWADHRVTRRPVLTHLPATAWAELGVPLPDRVVAPPAVPVIPPARTNGESHAAG